MKELAFVHPDYETRGDGDPSLFPGAHRVVRMAFSVGGIIHVPLELYADALNAFERVADSHAEERRYTAEEVALLAELFEQIRLELDASLDDQEHPRGPGGETITREANHPMTLDDGEDDDDRVFQLEPDGRISTVYPRMSLPDFRDRLKELVVFLQEAAARKVEVAVLG